MDICERDMGKGKNIAYIRVSTVEQNEARQKAALQKYCIDRWFIEKASGKDICPHGFRLPDQAHGRGGTPVPGDYGFL